MAETEKTAGYSYKGYNPKNSKHVKKYNQAHYKYAAAYFPKEFYDDELKPLCDDLGLSISAFVREAIIEKIERENSKEERGRD